MTRSVPFYKRGFRLQSEDFPKAVPGNARRRHPIVEERLQQVRAFAETFSYNRVEMGDTSLGIISNGIAYQYAREVFPAASFLKLG